MEHIHSPEGTNFTATQQIPIPHLVSNEQSYSEVCEMFRNAVNCYGYEMLAPRENSKLEDTPCRLSATVFSIYYQLSTYVGHFLQPLPVDAPQRDGMDAVRTAPIVSILIIIIIIIIIIQYCNCLLNSPDFCYNNL